MKRFLNRLFQGGLVFSLGLAMLWLLIPATTGAPKDEPAKIDLSELPIVEKVEHKSYSEELVGRNKTKVKFEMIAIPGGSYLMGSPKTEKGRNADEGPQHPVHVEPFWMGKCEVTWDEFDAYWKSGPPGKKDDDIKLKKDSKVVTRPTPAYADETFGHGRKGHPVLCISHHAAREYCHWLSKTTGKTYRLPTEAEWEWACRAGTTTPWSWGDDPKKVGEYAWYEDNADEITNKVGTKKPNPWGLHDMHGNLAEWCMDHYQKDYYSKFPLDKLTVQPVLLPSAKRFSHVARGGSWAHPVNELRSAERLASEPKWLRLDPQVPQSIWWLTSAEFVGFRVVRPVKQQDNLKGLRSKITRDSPDY